ncbi:hypothetical protein SAMN05660900_00872 [Megasphaera cerevisiae DSM 20462]|nr:hypothetical protein SAMN05660900_00872 [Megasphaera cerevisiae DSM 20462]
MRVDIPKRGNGFSCHCCRSENGTCEIYFEHDGHGSVITLCKSCALELADKINKHYEDKKTFTYEQPDPPLHTGPHEFEVTFAAGSKCRGCLCNDCDSHDHTVCQYCKRQKIVKKCTDFVEDNYY